MDNIMDIVKDKIEEVVAKVKGDNGMLAKFKANPMETVKELLGSIDLPDGALDNIVDGIKAKLGADTDGDGKADGLLGKAKDLLEDGKLGGLLDKAKDLFDGKKDE